MTDLAPLPPNITRWAAGVKRSGDLAASEATRRRWACPATIGIGSDILTPIA